MGQFKLPLILLLAFLIFGALLIYKFWPIETNSTATISLKNSRVVIEFNLLGKDQPKAKFLSEKLGVSNDWTRGGQIKLDSATTEFLKPFLPLGLELQFKEGEVDFNSNKIEALINQYLGKWKNINQEQLSPLGGNFKMSTENGLYLIEIDRPGEVLNQATTSGNLKVSPELINSPLWQVSNKLARIKLQVSEKGASGKIIWITSKR